MVAIALVGAMFVVFGTALVASALRNRARYETQAIALAEGALSAALTPPSSELTDRSGAPLVGSVEKRGDFGIATVTGTLSTPKAMVVTATSTAIYGSTSSLLVPNGPYGNATVSAAVSVPSDSSAGWRTGFIFRARDLGDCYRLTVGASNLTLEKLVGGTATTLYTGGSGLTAGSWTTLAVVTNGTTISFSRDGVPVGSVDDATFTSGETALVANGALARYDNVSVSNGQSYVWGFDSDQDGELPSEWSDVGIADLPGGTATMTVSHPTADASLAEVTVTVGWQGANGPQSVTETGYAG